MGYNQNNEATSPDKNILNDADAGYAKAETDLLKDALRRSYTERFLMTTRLYKNQYDAQKCQSNSPAFC